RRPRTVRAAGGDRGAAGGRPARPGRDRRALCGARPRDRLSGRGAEPGGRARRGRRPGGRADGARGAAARGLPVLPFGARRPARARRTARRGARRVHPRARVGRRRAGAQAADASAGRARRSLTYIGGVKTRRLLLKTIVAALCLTAGVAIVMLLAGTLDRTSAQILLTSTEVSFFGLLAVPAGVLLERNRGSRLGRSSAALTTVAFGLTLLVTWNPETSSAVWRGWGVVGTLALAAAQAATVEARRRDT